MRSEGGCARRDDRGRVLSGVRGHGERDGVRRERRHGQVRAGCRRHVLSRDGRGGPAGGRRHRPLGAERPGRAPRPPAARLDGRGGALGGTRRRLRRPTRIRRARLRTALRSPTRSAPGSPSSPATIPTSASSWSATSPTSRPSGDRSSATRAGVRGVVRAVSRGRLRRPEGRRPDAHRRRRRAFAPRKRPSVRAEQHLDVAGALPRSPRRAGTARAAGPGR